MIFNHINYKLEEIIDISLLQSIQEKLNLVYSYPSAIIDNDGNILTTVDWQDICTKFHRKNPQCEKECIKSNKNILNRILEANPPVSYQCPHGMIDNATPIIINGKHYGSFFTGQYFFEKPDLKFFRKQAEKYSFDEKAYLEAVDKVPIWTKEKHRLYLDFIKGFIGIIEVIGLQNLKEIESRKLIKESEEFTRGIIESSKDCIKVLDLEGNLLSMNAGGQKLMEIDDINVYLNKSYADLWKGKEREEVLKVISKVKKGDVGLFSGYCSTEKGTPRCWEIIFSSIKDSHGNICRLLAVSRDITVRKQAEDLLRKNEIFLKETQVIAMLGTFSMDVTTGRWESSEVLDSIYGIDSDYDKSLEGWMSIIHPEWQIIMTAYIFQEVVGKKIKFDKEHKIIRQNDNDERWVHAIGDISFDDDNRPTTLVLTIQEITKRKQSELALKESEKQLRQLNADKNLFISIIGHDLKGPFSSLLGFSELLSENIRKYDIDKIENFSNIINKSARSIYNLLEDILMWVNVQSGKIPFKPQWLSFADNCKNIIEILKPNADAKSIRINFHKADHLTVFADIDMLKTILRNLLSNAIKFTNRGGEINIAAKQSGSNIYISVSDNGIGITPDDLSKLFDISKIHSTMGTGEEEGNGLGL
ncbi:MAG: PocR ligand-binding domain-containing protein, partial [Bacteroidales bacterium]|nr:PocR ligand-binding domain-containing protein [Bacteroidales bacterium]